MIKCEYHNNICWEHYFVSGISGKLVLRHDTLMWYHFRRPHEWPNISNKYKILTVSIFTNRINSHNRLWDIALGNGDFCIPKITVIVSLPPRRITQFILELCENVFCLLSFTGRSCIIGFSISEKTTQAYDSVEWFQFKGKFENIIGKPAAGFHSCLIQCVNRVDVNPIEKLQWRMFSTPSKYEYGPGIAQRGFIHIFLCIHMHQIHHTHIPYDPVKYYNASCSWSWWRKTYSYLIIIFHPEFLSVFISPHTAKYMILSHYNTFIAHWHRRSSR